MNKNQYIINTIIFNTAIIRNIKTKLLFSPISSTKLVELYFFIITLKKKLILDNGLPSSNSALFLWFTRELFLKINPAYGRH